MVCLSTQRPHVCVTNKGITVSNKLDETATRVGELTKIIKEWPMTCWQGTTDSSGKLLLGDSAEGYVLCHHITVGLVPRDPYKSQTSIPVSGIVGQVDAERSHWTLSFGTATKR